MNSATARWASARIAKSAPASMDDLTAEAGLTRGALYHHFGDKAGLLRAVIDQIDAEMLARLHAVRHRAGSPWLRFVAENVAYIEMELEPETRRIVLLDGPAVLGDPSRWDNQSACLRTTTHTLQTLIDEGTVGPVDAKAAARLRYGAALSAALWIAAADDPQAVFANAVAAFQRLAAGLLRTEGMTATTCARPGVDHRGGCAADRCTA